MLFVLRCSSSKQMSYFPYKTDLTLLSRNIHFKWSCIIRYQFSIHFYCSSIFRNTKVHVFIIIKCFIVSITNITVFNQNAWFYVHLVMFFTLSVTYIPLKSPSYRGEMRHRHDVTCLNPFKSTIKLIKITREFNFAIKWLSHLHCNWLYRVVKLSGC